MKNNDAEKTNSDNSTVNQTPKYEPDDGMLTDEQIEKIKQFVPQVNFKSFKSLF